MMYSFGTELLVYMQHQTSFPGRIQTVSAFSSTTYAFQASGFILDCIREQDDHAEFITNIRELKDFGLELPNIGHIKAILLEHHLHRFGLFLKIKRCQQLVLS